VSISQIKEGQVESDRGGSRGRRGRTSLLDSKKKEAPTLGGEVPQFAKRERETWSRVLTDPTESQNEVLCGERRSVACGSALLLEDQHLAGYLGPLR